jgi:hypothetical protein
MPGDMPELQIDAPQAMPAGPCQGVADHPGRRQRLESVDQWGQFRRALLRIARLGDAEVELGLSVHAGHSAWIAKAVRTGSVLTPPSSCGANRNVIAHFVSLLLAFMVRNLEPRRRRGHRGFPLVAARPRIQAPFILDAQPRSLSHPSSAWMPSPGSSASPGLPTHNRPTSLKQSFKSKSAQAELGRQGALWAPGSSLFTLSASLPVQRP